jgi:hypothetical protein
MPSFDRLMLRVSHRFITATGSTLKTTNIFQQVRAMSDNCLFCKIISGAIPSEKLGETEKVGRSAAAAAQYALSLPAPAPPPASSSD